MGHIKIILLRNRETLINNLYKENFSNNDDGFQTFCHINKHAPRKKKKHA